MWETWVPFLGWEDPLEKEMVTHCSIFAWRIPWTEEPGGLQSMGLQCWTWWSDWAWACARMDRHTHTHRNKISLALKKEQNAIVECSLLCEWPFSLSFFFFLLVLFPSVCPHTTPMPAKSLPWFLFLQTSCQLWKLPDKFFSSLLFYFH